jgi:hypothetical protein
MHPGIGHHTTQDLATIHVEEPWKNAGRTDDLLAFLIFYDPDTSGSVRVLNV